MKEPSSGQAAIGNEFVDEGIELEHDHLRAVLDALPDVVWLKDAEGVFIACNPQFERLIGAHEADIIGKTDFDFVEKELAEAYRRADRQAVAAGCPTVIEEWLTFAEDGRRILAETIKTPVVDKAGKLIGVLGIARDVTGRRQAEETLRDSEARFRHLVDHAPDAIVVHDIDLNRFVDANASAERLFGCERSELLKWGPHRFYPPGQPDSRPVEQSIHDNVLRALAGEVVVSERLVRSADGRDSYCDVTLVRLPDRRRRLLRASLVDISERRRLEQKSNEMAQLNQKIIASSMIGIISYRVETGQCVMANDAAAKIMGATVDQLLEQNFRRLESWKKSGLWNGAEQALASGGEHRGRFRHRSTYGKEAWVEVLLTSFLNEDEQHLLLMFEDVTERMLAEGRLNLAASVFTHAREGIVITDAEGAIVDVNDTFTRITGYSRAEALGQNPRILKSGRQTPEFYAGMWRALVEKGDWYGEIWNRRKNGDVFAEILTISAVRDGEGKTQNYVALFTDITSIKDHQQQLERIAHYDALTNLPNQVLLADRLHQGIVQSQRRGKSLAVVYVDLDGFKPVNDNHGHLVGDELLIAVAQRMKAALREGDTLARVGGDEFVAVLADLEHLQDCEAVLHRLLAAAAAPVTVGEALLQVSASMGVTLFPQDKVDADKLLRHADQAMYQAKQAGKNRYHLFDVAEDAAVKTRRESLDHIRKALYRDEFVLHYQPKVNMRTGEVVGAEALIRWQHPERGLLLPAEFLPVVGNHAVGVELGEWVIDTALCQIAEWRAAGLNIPVSVNVGASQLLQDDFGARLGALLAAHPDVPPANLELEILETDALEDMAQVSELLRTCRDMGVSFSLDDFGTGYSSLTYLKRLSVGQLKIDQTFVRDMLDDADDLAIVEGVVGLAEAFHRRVIAEGVETVAHGQLLLPLGCELAQGYGIARPMPAAELPDWVASWRPDAAWTTGSGRAPSRDELAVLFAEVEHRQWARSIEGYLADESPALPPMNPLECRFGHWEEGEGREHYGSHPDFPAVVDLHRRLHEQAAQLIGRKADGHEGDTGADTGVRELHALRDQLIRKLRSLIGEGLVQ